MCAWTWPRAWHGCGCRSLSRTECAILSGQDTRSSSVRAQRAGRWFWGSTPVPTGPGSTPDYLTTTGATATKERTRMSGGAGGFERTRARASRDRLPSWRCHDRGNRLGCERGGEGKPIDARDSAPRGPSGATCCRSASSESTRPPECSRSLRASRFGPKPELREVEAVQHHDLVRRLHEVLHELRLRIAARVHLGERPELRVRTKDQVHARRGPLYVETGESGIPPSKKKANAQAVAGPLQRRLERRVCFERRPHSAALLKSAKKTVCPSFWGWMGGRHRQRATGGEPDTSRGGRVLRELSAAHPRRNGRPCSRQRTPLPHISAGACLGTRAALTATDEKRLSMIVFSSSPQDDRGRMATFTGTIDVGRSR